MEDLKIAQNEGTVKAVNTNKPTNDYKIPENERHLLHAQLETPSFSPVTGERTSKPFVQSFYPEEFDKMEAEKHFAGMQVEILHDPRSDKKATADKVEAMATSGFVDMSLEKPLDQMNKAELQKKYASMYQEEPDASMTVAQLRDAITEKIEFIRGEEAALHVNEANEGTGIVAGPGGANNTETSDKDAKKDKSAK